ncbi:selenium metabolism protein YedF [Desulfuromonas versatilis]|uniref:Selenium metabolism protein YedF n=1 Tax=Desulfuromonas versatilis TaxID=2802975 RepID=A0ABN6DW54_9BACT|nr:sulfurtransferase-like selenium metabolism protein YedF [Desulfuromonas versatilis]BCR04012.1 selenium metabolism protein YedF [Desulfuromonas versatilis]
MTTLDCRAHKCPHPVVETRKLLLASPGTPLTVLVGDETARENVSRLARSQGYQVEATPSEGGFTLQLSPGTAPASTVADAPAAGKTVAFITADTLGDGNEELGRILMKNFIFTLAELDAPPDTLLFANAGVKLTTEGSEVLEALEKIACMGSDIASCGLCLEFYQLKDKLAAGRATNMLDIVETLQKAGRVIRP